MVKEMDVPLADSFNYVRGLRPQVDPNKGFMLKLAQLEAEASGGISVYFHKGKRERLFFEI